MVETEIGLRTCRKIKIKRNKIVGGKGGGDLETFVWVFYLFVF